MDKKNNIRMAIAAWLLASIYYFYQYTLRSAPSVMMPELSEAFGLSALGVAALVGLFYFGYSPFSLVAGVALDRLGAKKVVPLGAAFVGIGAFLFATGNESAANVGRFLQGAGGVFALIGAIYIATKHFSATLAATMIGATQMFGMAGGAAGQFAVGPMISKGLPWNYFWMGMGAIGIILSIALIFILPKEEKSNQSDNWVKDSVNAFKSVFSNPQSILCGMIAGLLFIPTTIFDMVWGVRFLQEGHGFDYSTAVIRSSMVPVGWIIGCPLLGFISDKIGRRKPVIIGGATLLLACLGFILYGPTTLFPPYILGLVAGLASGAAMLPYTVIKEANSPKYGGTATGVVNFLNFTFSALLGPVFANMLINISETGTQGLEKFQAAFQPLLFGVGLAMVLAFILKETGTATALKKSSH
jgi:MFS family permease